MTNGKITDTTDVVITNASSSFQTIVDAVVNVNKSLYDQQAALQTQILDLNKQLNDINVQIAATETVDLKKARGAKRILDLIGTDQGQLILKRVGLAP